MNFPAPDQVAGWNAQPPAARRGKTPVVVLAVLAAVFAITAGVFTVFYFGAQAEVDRVAAEQADKDAGIKTATDRLEQAEVDLKDANTTLSEAKDRNTSLTDERDQLALCTEAAGKYIDSKPDTAERDKWFDQMYEHCRDV
ncbi:hypothetical protein GCM10023148_37560 [Actinokineospora soli]